MILKLERFIAAEKPLWDELDAELRLFDRDPFRTLNTEQASRFYFLYQRAASDLARLGELPGEPEIRAHLEVLVRRAYAETSEARRWSLFSLRRFLFRMFPSTFRAHIKAFWLSCAITLLGALFGAGAMAWDPNAKPVLMPFQQLIECPHIDCSVRSRRRQTR